MDNKRFNIRWWYPLAIGVGLHFLSKGVGNIVVSQEYALVQAVLVGLLELLSLLVIIALPAWAIILIIKRGIKKFFAKMRQTRTSSNADPKRTTFSKESNNLLRISLIVGILVISISLGYYFLYFVPKMEMDKINARMDCARLAAQKAKTYDNGLDISAFDSNYDKKYDNYFKRCLQEKGVIN